ncbi:MAG TPA: hypothetical protein VNZ56_09720 [Verrucomicrobiae bacterium]|jgi:hypothetical protein|nr:hypothetical protein [Verrucomicrobiae bacterium]
MIENQDRLRKGSRPPYIGLSEAFALITQIYELGGGRVTKDVISRATKNSSSSSSLLRKVSALKSYGMLIEDNGGYLLTDIGMAVAAPTNPESLAHAKKAAFQSLDVFSKVFERHKGKLLPADEFLKNILEQDLSLPKGVSGQWVSSVKESLKSAGLLYDRGDGKMQIMESPIVRFPRVKDQSPTPIYTSPETDGKRNIENEPQTAEFVPASPTGHTSKIALSRQRYAIFSIPDALTARDAQKIKSAINGISTIIDSLVEEETN